MKLAVKISLGLTPEQEYSLDGQSRICNWLYNQLLERANQGKEEFKETGSSEASKRVYTKVGLRNLVPGLKKEHPFLLTCHCAPLKNAALRLSRSIKRFQSDRKLPKSQQQGVGWPKFRSSKKKFFSLEYDEYGNGYFIRRVNNQWFLDLSLGENKEGPLKLRIEILEMPQSITDHLLHAEKEHEKAKLQRKKVKSAEKLPPLRKLLPFTGIRIKKEGSCWSAILSLKKPVPEPVSEVRSVAVIDPNHKNLGYLVDTEGNGIEIENLWFVKPLDRRIDEIKARRDQCKKNSVTLTREDGSKVMRPSRRWKFFQNYLDELYRKRREQIKSALYTFSNELTRYYDFIAVGDYTPHGGGISTGMRRSMNNQSQIGKFKQTLNWVCIREGKNYFEWDEDKSTKTCSQCGHPTGPIQDPSVRHWQCVECKTQHIRDENAAMNGFKKVAQEIKKLKVPCSGQIWEKVEKEKISQPIQRCAWRFHGSGIHVSRANECVQSQPQEIQRAG